MNSQIESKVKKTVLDVNKVSLDERKDKYFQKIAENKKYNDEILNDIPDSISKGNLVGGNIILKVLKYDGYQTNDGKLIEPKWKLYETDAGKKASIMEQISYSTRAIVIKKPSIEYISSLDNKVQSYLYDQLKEKETIIWVKPSRLESANPPEFKVDRQYPNVMFEGYISLGLSDIEFIEN
jgi:hypothetical protein